MEAEQQQLPLGLVSQNESYYNPELENLARYHTIENDEDCIPLRDRAKYFPSRKNRAKREEIVEYSSYPNKLLARHYKELTASGISETLIKINFYRVTGVTCHELLYPNSTFKPINNVLQGGWTHANYDILHGTDSSFKQVKLDIPSVTTEGEIKKYLCPLGLPTSIFLPKVDEETARKIAANYNLDYELDSVAGKWIEFFAEVPPFEKATFWEWVVVNSIPVYIVEGFKKTVSLLSHGQVAIGLPGVTMATLKGKRILKPELAVFTKVQRKWVICFDQDLKDRTVRAVYKASLKIAELLAPTALGVYYLSWDNKFKGIDDFFGAGGKEVRELPHELKPPTSNSIVFETQYLPSMNEWKIPVNTNIVAIKSAYSTGKSGSFSLITSHAIAQKKFTIILCPTQSLVSMGCKRAGLPHKSHWTPEDREGVVMCIHSFNPYSTVGRVLFPWLDEFVWNGGEVEIIMDEAQTIFKSLFLENTKTMEQWRRSIIDSLAKYSIRSRFWLFDNDLDVHCVDFLKKLCKMGEIENPTDYWVINNFQNQLEQVYLFPSTNLDLKLINPQSPIGIVPNLLKTCDNMVLVQLTGQSVEGKKGLNSTLSAEEYYKKLGLSVIRIDRETVSDVNHPAYNCLSNLNQFLLEQKKAGIRVILTSPILKTGVSIEDPEADQLFDFVVSVNTGILSPDLVLQSLFRYRNFNVPRIIFVARRGLVLLSHGSTNNQEIYKHEQQQNRLSKQLYNCLEVEDDKTTNFALNEYCRLASINNMEMGQYNSIILNRITMTSKNISYVLPDSSGVNLLTVSTDKVKKELKSMKQVITQKRVQETIESPDLTHTEAQEIERSLKNKEDSLKLKKYKIKEIFKLREITPEHVINYDLGIVMKLKLLYYSTVGYKWVKIRDEKKLSAHRDRDIVRENKDVLYHKANLINRLFALGLKEVLDTGEISNQSPAVLQFMEQIRFLQKDIKSVLGIKFYQSPIELISMLGKMLGFKLLSIKKLKLADGERLRIYKVVSSWENKEGEYTLTLHELTDELFKSWEQDSEITALSHFLKTKVTEVSYWEQQTTDPRIVEYLKLKFS